MGSDIEHVRMGQINQFPTAARNCFSGSFEQLALLLGRQVEEPAIMEAGDGYLLRAGLDERSSPEFVFGVESVILSGLTALGYETRATAIEPAGWREQLRELLADNAGVVVWVNSAHLDYAEVYSSHPGFMHAVLVLELSADLRRIRVFDSLVSERNRYSCAAWMPDSAFEGAILDRLRSKSLDHMGRFHTLAAPHAGAGTPSAAAGLFRQAETFRTTPCYANAVQEYGQLCREALAGDKESAKHAVRWFFDHVNVLYVLPSLELLDRSLLRAGAPAAVSELCRSLMADWRLLGLQALKFEATLSSAIATRMDERFDRLSTATTHLWDVLHREMGSGT